jgi:hypothetical protein
MCKKKKKKKRKGKYHKRKIIKRSRDMLLKEQPWKKKPRHFVKDFCFGLRSCRTIKLGMLSTNLSS